MARTIITDEMTIDYCHKPINEVTTEEVQIRESWYNDQVQRHYTSTIFPFETKGSWIDVPGTQSRYACRITKQQDNIVVALKQRIGPHSKTGAICSWNIINRDPSGKCIPASTVSQCRRWDFSQYKETARISYTNPTWFPSMDAILDNKSVLEHGYFDLTIQLWEPENCGPQANDPPHPFGIMVEMANRFAYPLQMNDTVEFQCPNNREGKLKTIYAWAPVLSGRSEYFKTMFESGFAEGTGAKMKSTANGKTRRKPPPKKTRVNPSFTNGKKQIVIEDDYDIFHNILYYIYTNRITFSTDLTVEPVNSNFPRLCATEDIYEMANRMLLDDLRLKAFNFIKFKCTVENITERLFSRFACLYEEVGEMYMAYFRENFENIEKTQEYRRFFENLESEGDLDDIVTVLNRYRKVMANATFGKS